MVPHQWALRNCIRLLLGVEPCHFKMVHSICCLANSEALAAFFHPHLRHRLDLADTQFDQQHLPNSFKFTAVCHPTCLRLTIQVHHIQKLCFEKTRLHQSYARDDFEIASFHQHQCAHFCQTTFCSPKWTTSQMMVRPFASSGTDISLCTQRPAQTDSQSLPVCFTARFDTLQPHSHVSNFDVTKDHVSKFIEQISVYTCKRSLKRGALTFACGKQPVTISLLRIPCALFDRSADKVLYALLFEVAAAIAGVHFLQNTRQAAPLWHNLRSPNIWQPRTSSDHTLTQVAVACVQRHVQ